MAAQRPLLWGNLEPAGFPTPGRPPPHRPSAREECPQAPVSILRLESVPSSHAPVPCHRHSYCGHGIIFLCLLSWGILSLLPMALPAGSPGGRSRPSQPGPAERNAGVSSSRLCQLLCLSAPSHNHHGPLQLEPPPRSGEVDEPGKGVRPPLGLGSSVSGLAWCLHRSRAALQLGAETLACVCVCVCMAEPRFPGGLDSFPRGSG